MKKVTLILLVITMFFAIGCKKHNTIEDNEIDSNIEPTPANIPTPIPTPEVDNREGKTKSYLSGLWIPEEVANKRPYALQFSNYKSVSNQWGISEADIIYEALVEGGITRFIAIGEDFTSDRLGSIRSARQYFVSIVEEYDPIYIHFGGSKYANAKLSELKTENLDGLTGIGTTVFYRDNSMKAPHNAFTSLEGILAGIESKGYEMERDQDYEPHFLFYDEDTDLPSETLANKIKINFSSYTSPSFEYNKEDKLYYRYQFGGPHIDSNTGKQLTFKNLIIQYVDQHAFDRNGNQTIDFEEDSGYGIFISNGKQIPITWEKSEKASYMRYFTEDGKQLTINPGKTFITIFPENRTKDIIFGE